MATVTKLKAAVNNKNLPILGEDGNLYNYFYGRFYNKIVEQGYIPTEGEKAALNAFLNDGVNNGWLDAVAYLIPFIGDENHPKAGIVPLVDNMSDYVITENTVHVNSFNYFANGKIKCFTNGNAERYPLGFKSNQLGFSDAYSIYANLSYESGDEVKGLCNNLMTLLSDIGTNAVYIVRKGYVGESEITSKNSIIFLTRTEDVESASTYEFTQSAVQVDNLPYKFDLFYSKYIDEDSVVKYKKYYKGGSYVNGVYSSGNSSTGMGYAITSYSLGGTRNRGMVSKCNIFAQMFPALINNVVLDSFTSAVATLNTTLGR
jgi:hypothetical protein